LISCDDHKLSWLDVVPGAVESPCLNGISSAKKKREDEKEAEEEKKQAEEEKRKTKRRTIFLTMIRWKSTRTMILTTSSILTRTMPSTMGR